MKKNNQNKGITLIALIITVIVLLILAGVGIAALNGDEGLLKRAGDTKKYSEQASGEELIQIEVFGSYEKNGDLIAKKLKDNINNNISGATATTTSTDSGEDFPITVTLNEKTYKIKNDGTVKQLTNSLADTITPENYGDYVNYDINLQIDGNWNSDLTDVDDWRIFYNDGDNVFIIAADSIPNNLDYFDVVESNINKIDNYRIRWSTDINNIQLQDVKEQVINKFMANKYELNSQLINSKCASTLLNSDNWIGLVDNSLADFAIGSPTFEMWAESWKQSGYPEIEYTIGDYGYVFNDTNTTNIADLGNKNLYIPHSGWYVSYYGYWLSSPIQSSNDGCLVGQNGTNLNGNYYNNLWGGLRPIVQLKSQVIGEQVNRNMEHSYLKIDIGNDNSTLGKATKAREIKKFLHFCNLKY